MLREKPTISGIVCITLLLIIFKTFVFMVKYFSEEILYNSIASTDWSAASRRGRSAISGMAFIALLYDYCIKKTLCLE